jgi:heme/copper-type cytochrome/quinol oxidase subunit 3
MGMLLVASSMALNMAEWNALRENASIAKRWTVEISFSS